MSQVLEITTLRVVSMPPTEKGKPERKFLQMILKDYKSKKHEFMEQVTPGSYNNTVTYERVFKDQKQVDTANSNTISNSEIERARKVLDDRANELSKKLLIQFQKDRLVQLNKMKESLEDTTRLLTEGGAELPESIKSDITELKKEIGLTELSINDMISGDYFIDYSRNTREEVRELLVPILDENGSIFEYYGSKFDGSMDYENDSSAEWKDRVVNTIIPNNRKILRIISHNHQLLTKEESVVCTEFQIHSSGLEMRHTTNLEVDEPTYPVGMNELFSGSIDVKETTASPEMEVTK